MSTQDHHYESKPWAPHLMDPVKYRRDYYKYFTAHNGPTIDSYWRGYAYIQGEADRKAMGAFIRKCAIYPECWGQIEHTLKVNMYLDIYARSWLSRLAEDTEVYWATLSKYVENAQVKINALDHWNANTQREPSQQEIELKELAYLHDLACMIAEFEHAFEAAKQVERYETEERLKYFESVEGMEVYGNDLSSLMNNLGVSSNATHINGYGQDQSVTPSYYPPTSYDYLGSEWEDTKSSVASIINRRGSKNRNEESEFLKHKKLDRTPKPKGLQWVWERGELKGKRIDAPPSSNTAETYPMEELPLWKSGPTETLRTLYPKFLREYDKLKEVDAQIGKVNARLACLSKYKRSIEKRTDISPGDQKEKRRKCDILWGKIAETKTVLEKIFGPALLDALLRIRKCATLTHQNRSHQDEMERCVQVATSELKNTKKPKQEYIRDLVVHEITEMLLELPESFLRLAEHYENVWIRQAQSPLQTPVRPHRDNDDGQSHQRQYRNERGCQTSDDQESGAGTHQHRNQAKRIKAPSVPKMITNG